MTVIRVLQPNGARAPGAEVTLYAGPGDAITSLLGVHFSASGITNANGEYYPPPPTIFSAPIGSTVDVKVLWYDSAGRPYYGKGTLSVVASIFHPETGFEWWSPDELNIVLSPASAEKVQEIKQTQQEAQAPTAKFTQELTSNILLLALVLGIVYIVVRRVA